jgi:hypothetical protein
MPVSLIRFLYTQNPFYLIGTFVILFGLQQSLGAEPQLASSGMLSSLLALYTLLLTGVAIVIVRWGNLWDDVRTILLVIVLLFYMLSTSLDVQVLEQPEAGTYLLAAGLLFSLAVSEMLFRQLRLQLPLEYRAAFYLSLAILFLYPIALAWISFYRWYELRTWALGSFCTIAALPLLFLIPAARSRQSVPMPCRNTWQAPYYPWSLFVFLTIGMGMRAWWLTISFDPTKGAGNCFQPYFLIPLVLVWAVIFVEAGLVHARKYALAAGLLLPWVAVGLGYWGAGTTNADKVFLASLTDALGAPPQLAVWSVLAFQGWAFWRTIGRRVNGWQELAVTAAAVLACATGRETLDWQTLVMPNAAGLALVAAGWMANAWRLNCSYRALVAASLGGLFVLCSDLLRTWPSQFGDPHFFWRMHSPALILLALLAVFQDHVAERMRAWALSVIPTLAVAAATIYPWWFGDVPPLQLAAYLGYLTLISVRLWHLDRQVPQLAATTITTASNLVLLAWPVAEWLANSWLAAGLPFLLGGLAVVAAGVFVSLLKMGIVEQARDWLRQVNEHFQMTPTETS